MRCILLVLSSLLILYTYGGGIYNGCVFNLTDSHGMTAEYDLSWFDLAKHGLDEVFRVTDSQNRAYEYFFNICGAIPKDVFFTNTTIPTECRHPGQNHGPCIASSQVNSNSSNIPNCTTYEDTTGEIPSALQVELPAEYNNNVTQCYWLGMEVKTSEDIIEYKKELLDPDDAGKGVIFTILNGEWCDVVGKNRELRIKLKCPDEIRIEFEPGLNRMNIMDEPVDEPDTCVYEIEYESALACPNKCVSRMNMEMFAVCATHGICEADPYGNGKSSYPKGQLRCLCDDGYKGDICEGPNNEIKVIDQTHPGLLAAIVICIILLGIAIVCAAVLCHKIRMKEIEEQQGMDQFSGGMLHDDADANLAQKKADAMTMNIGVDDGNQLATSGTVQLQTVDDQLETDKNKNALLQDVDDEEEEEEEEEDDNESDNDDDAEQEEEEETNPGGDD